MKEHSYPHRFFLIVVFICVAVFCAYFKINTTQLQKIGTEIRVDIEPITRRYPQIENISSVEWCSGPFSDATFGKNAYWLEGFLQLSVIPKSIEDIHDWEAVKDLVPKFFPNISTINEVQWYHSEKLDEYYSSSIMFYTKFYYSPDKLMLYIYAETD